MTTTVLISGASGFVALHIVQELVKKGYTVVGSVRSEEKGEYVKKNSGNPEKVSYEIVEDIEQEGAFDEFVKKHPEATVFLHTASPFHFETLNSERDLLLPAVNGTKNALTSIHKNGENIKRVVVTSSYAAIASAEMDQESDKTWDESTWNDITWEKAKEDPVLGYYGSKTFAEKAAWDFVKNEKPKFALSTVNPTYVFGPQPTDEFETTKLNTSSELINTILKIKGTEEKVNPVSGSAVDVRDVAKAHIVAFEKDAAKDQRLFLNSGSFTQQTILDIVHTHFASETQHVPMGNPGSDREDVKKRATLNNDKTRKLLGFELITVEQSIKDSAEQILKVEDKLKTVELPSKHQQL